MAWRSWNMVIYYSKVPHLTSPPKIIISGSAMVFRLYGLVCAVMLLIFTLVNFFNMKLDRGHKE